MKPILIEYDPITGARLVLNDNNVATSQESAQSKKVRIAFHNAAKRKNAIVTRQRNNLKHK